MLEGPLRATNVQILGLCLVLAACSGHERDGEKDGADSAPATTPRAPAKRVATAPANGWGEEIAWRSFDEGLAEAKKERMPLMLVVHTSWCSKCKSLKKSTFRDTALHELSEDFVMVNVDQDAEPAATEYAPDGTYIPRVMFLDPDGKLDQELHNPRPSRFKYFYLPQDDLVSTMRKALERHGKET